LTDPRGDTAGLLRRDGIESIARLDSAEEIALELRRFLDKAKSGKAALSDDGSVIAASRQKRAQELAGLLDRLPVPESTA
jgi:hypothetical protein